jgi:hypothetical protein
MGKGLLRLASAAPISLPLSPRRHRQMRGPRCAVLRPKADNPRRVALMRTIGRLNLRFDRETVSFAAAPKE